MKIKQIFSLLLALCTMISCICLAGCKQQETQMQYEVPHYQGQLKDGQEISDYNKNLFYRNDFIKAKGADPFVLDNTARDGYYYLYVTEDNLFCYRSKDMMTWENVGNSLDIQKYKEVGGLTEERRVLWKDIWAPEVVFDPDTNLYYIFFSATPDLDTEVEVGKGVLNGSAKEVLFVAVSERPDRDFQLVNFMDANSCGAENLHSFNMTPGQKDENGNYITAYPHYFSKYLLFDPAQYKAFSDANGGYRGASYGGFEGGIDPHPYVDENGDKWLFWVDSTGSDRICCVKMINWLKPDWSTATALLYHSYYTVEDWKASLNGEYVDLVPYELQSTTINEGPHVVKHNNKYYLTFSVGAYSDNSYQVAQAVADNINGPYRKLTMEEGGLILSSELSGSMEVSGPGHHSFVTVGDQMLIVYHRHNDAIVGGGARNMAVDELKWVSIKDKDGNDLDVLYTNGATATVQPRFDAYAEYKNIADKATVGGDGDLIPLTDDLLSTFKYYPEEFAKYIPETIINKTTTFTFDFQEAQSVRAVMVYNSKLEDQAFINISRMEFVCEEDGREVIRYIEDVKFHEDGYKANDYDGAIYYVVPGAAAYAEFDELNVKSVRITVDVPEGQESVGISEIRILGK